MNLKPLFWAPLLLSALTVHAQSTTAVRSTELRADKLGNAQVVATLEAGAALNVVSIEGGWALVESGPATARMSGWVRASALNLQSGASTASGMASGRQAGGNTAMTLGVRSLQPRVNRHALIIGISRYQDPSIPSLPGARIDRESATQMATAMQVPASNIQYLQDDQATGPNIRKAIQDLTDKVQEGDRVFIHYSGHGTRYNDPAAGGCVEALLAYDGGQSGTITNREMADLLKSITTKTDKLIVMYDACHSGGLVNLAPTVRARGIGNVNDEGVLRPKFASISEECGRPVNVKTRNLVVESTRTGALPQDIIHLSASRDNEISFDDELKGGLATQFVRDCMLRDAKDLDGSGAITMEDIRICAQEKIDKRMRNDPNFKPHNITLSGNTAFVPAWFSQAPTPVAVAVPLVAVAPSQSAAAAQTRPPQAVAVTSAPAATPAAPASRPPATGTAAPAPTAPAATVAVAVSTPAAPAPAPVNTYSGEQALRQMFDQRDAKRQVQVSLGKDKLKIGQDALDFSVRSDRAGYVYVALAGSDNKSLYLLFPNDLDQGNKIQAGESFQLPRPNWRVKAAGPAGMDNLLVLVTDGPRDLTQLGASKAGPFLASLNDANGRAKLGALMTTSSLVTSQECTGIQTRKNNPVCSDAYGASMISLEELK